MVGNKIKNNEIIINDLPYSKWTQKEWNIWRSQTRALMYDTQRIFGKLNMLAKIKGWIA